MSPHLQASLYRQLTYQARQATVELELPAAPPAPVKAWGPRLKGWLKRTGLTLGTLSLLIGCRLGLSLTALVSEVLSQQDVLRAVNP